MHWAQNCLRIFKLSKLMNGKGIHPSPICQSHIHPEEEYKFEYPPPPPLRTDYPQKYSEMSADVPNPSSHVGKKRTYQQLHGSPCPYWGPQLSKAVNSKPVPATGPQLNKAGKATYPSDRIFSSAKVADSNRCIHTS